MYIYKNNSGIKLTIEEFIEIMENDLLNELISIVVCLDDPGSVVREILGLYEVSEDERVDRIMGRLLGELEDRGI